MRKDTITSAKSKLAQFLRSLNISGFCVQNYGNAGSKGYIIFGTYGTPFTTLTAQLHFDKSFSYVVDFDLSVNSGASDIEVLAASSLLVKIKQSCPEFTLEESRILSSYLQGFKHEEYLLTKERVLELVASLE